MTIGSLSGSGIVQNASGVSATLTTGGDGFDTTFSGTLQNNSGGGTLALTFNGSGYMALSGSNSYSGNTTISAGYLRIGAVANLGNSTTIATTGTLQATGSFILPSKLLFSGRALIDVFGDTLTDSEALTASANPGTQRRRHAAVERPDRFRQHHQRARSPSTRAPC